MRGLGRFIAAALVLASAPASAQPVAHGDAVVNVARVSWTQGLEPVESSPAVVLAVVPSPAAIELLQHAPGLASARLEPVVPGAFRAGPASGDPLAAQGPPRRAGAAAPLDLSAPLPLAPATQLHQNDPVFVRLADADQNLDPTTRETVLVALGDDLTGDAEIFLLTESGPDTGVFIGYVQTVGVPTAGAAQRVHDGLLEVVEGSRLSARYVDPDDAVDAVAAAVLVDPAGVVFDSSSGLPVNGATVTVIDVATGLSAQVFGDDGTSAFPSSVISGGTAQDALGRVYSFPPGGYRFPFMPPGTYRLEVTPPPGYRAPSTVATAALQTLPGAPFAVVDPGSRGEPFALDPGPALRIDVPLDPRPAGRLWVVKTAGRVRAGVGEAVPYQLDVINADATAAVAGVEVVDVLPVGFRYRRGTTRIAGARAADPAVSADGRTLTFGLGALAPSQSVAVRYVTHVGAGARPGTDAVNAARARSAGGETSNTAKASVRISDDFFTGRALVIGRVTTGPCDARDGVGSEGVPSARVVLEDGTSVVTDRAGLYHFEGVKPGAHVVQLDLDSLPEGFVAVACTENDRFAGRAFSQFVDVQGGTTWRADFHVRPATPPAVAPAPPPPPVAAPAPVAAEPAQAAVSPGRRLALSLRLRVENATAEVVATVRGEAPAGEALRVEVVLPEGLVYVPGSSVVDGVAIADPRVEGRVLRYDVATEGVEWTRVMTVRARVTLDAQPGARRVEGVALLSGAGAVVATSTSRIAVEVVREREITLRPHFATLSDVLGPGDIEELRRVAQTIDRKRAQRVVVIGHTDAHPITGRGRERFPDNEALSLARARTVARALASETGVPLEAFVTEGRGPAEPVATNETASGRALNRRVEVTMMVARPDADATLRWMDDSAPEASSAAPGEATEAPAAKAVAPATLPAASDGAPAPARTPATSVEPPPVPSPAASPPSASAPGPAVSAGPATSGAAPATAATGSAGARRAPAPAEAGAKPLLDGLVSPRDGDLLPDRVTAVQIRLASYLTPRLEVDGKEVPAERIGFKRNDPQSGHTAYTYVGVEFGDPGTHTVRLAGLDPFGNARFQDRATVTRVGDIASIRLVSAEGNVADGKTPVRMQFEVLDASGNPVRGAIRLDLREGTLRPYRPDGSALATAEPDADRRVVMDANGWVLFQPVSVAGPYRAVVGVGAVTADAETWATPRMREWILVGLAEGTVGHDLVSGNMEALPPGTEEELWADGKVALYAKGQIRGEWLATVALDTSRTRGEAVAGRSSLFQTLDPQEFYTLYGDGTQQGYDAPSSRKLYLRIERERFYALFGDYDTGLTATELSRYSRRMNGVKTELQARHVELNAFATRTDLVYARDEIPGEGTSGIYRLSNRGITLNSEVVTIVARDRFRSEIVVSSRTLTRFVDYAIDYDAGTLLFREPIWSRDEDLNPVTIVVEYETLVLGTEDYSAGGRAGVKLLGDRVRAGVTGVHEGLGERRRDLVGVDATVRLLPRTQLRAERAMTERTAADVRERGGAWLAELQHQGRAFDARLHLRQLDPEFGLGQQPLSEAGSRKLGLDTALRLDERFGVTGQAFRQEFFADDSTRTVAEARATWLHGPASGSLGLLDARDELADGSTHSSGQVVASAKVRTIAERLTLGLDYAQSAWGNANTDYPTRLAGRAEYQLTPDLAVVAVQELTFGDRTDTQDTRIGLRAAPWKGASLVTSVERQLRESGERVLGTVGLRQTWQLTDAWKLDAGVERSETLRRPGAYELNAGFPPASGGAEDFTALSAGASHQAQHLLWDGRAELRLAEQEDRWGLQSGLVAELSRAWGLSGRARVFRTDARDGSASDLVELRFGTVYRPAATRWILLDRLDAIVERRGGAGAAGPGPTATLAFGDTDSWRLVNNVTANYRPRKDVQLSLGHGAKFVRERLEGALDQGFTDQRSAEARVDLSKRWDVGLRASMLQTWEIGALAYSGGPSVGFSPVANAWIALGVNLVGYHDRDFSASEYTAAGPYLKLRFKFDQESVREAARWINRQ